MLNNGCCLGAGSLLSGRIQLSHRPAQEFDPDTSVKNGFAHPWRPEYYQQWDSTKHRRYPVLKSPFPLQKHRRMTRNLQGILQFPQPCDANYSHYQSLKSSEHFLFSAHGSCDETNSRCNNNVTHTHKKNPKIHLISILLLFFFFLRVQNNQLKKLSSMYIHTRIIQGTLFSKTTTSVL